MSLRSTIRGSYIDTPPSNLDVEMCVRGRADNVMGFDWDRLGIGGRQDTEQARKWYQKVSQDSRSSSVQA